MNKYVSELNNESNISDTKNCSYRLLWIWIFSHEFNQF